MSWLECFVFCFTLGSDWVIQHSRLTFNVGALLEDLAIYFAFSIQWFQWCILICTWCILLLLCCILFNSDASYFYIVASWTTISFNSAALLFTPCLWSVIIYLLYILRFSIFYLQRGILSNSSPTCADANGWKYRVVTVGIRALVALGKTQHIE